jgi:hypothetical protein
MWTQLASSQGIAGDVAPSASTGGYFARYDVNGQALAYAVVYAGVDAPSPIAVVPSDDGMVLAPTTTLTLAPGQSLALMHFVLVRQPGDQLGVIATADALTLLDDPDVLQQLTPAEQAEIVNFRLVP